MAAKIEQIDSTIGEDSVFEGSFDVRGSLRVDGKFKGEVKIEDELIIGETGKVKTNVFAKRVIVGGTFIGNIEATEEVILLENGKVLGDITTPILTVQKGVVTLGKIHITSNKFGADAIRQVIEDSYGLEKVLAEVIPEKKELQKKA